MDGAQGVKGEKAGALTTKEAERVGAAPTDCFFPLSRARQVSQDSRDSRVRPGMSGCLGRREQWDPRDCVETRDPRSSFSSSKVNKHKFGQIWAHLSMLSTLQTDTEDIEYISKIYYFGLIITRCIVCLLACHPHSYSNMVVCYTVRFLRD